MKIQWNFIHLSTLIAATILCGLCLALPLIQWVSIPTDIIEKWVMGFAILALGICKLTFFPLSVDNFRERQYVAAIALGSMAAIALAISISATTDLLTKLVEQRHALTTTQEWKYQQLNSRLSIVNTEIETLQRAIAIDIDAGYRKRAYEQRKKVDELLKQKAEMESDIQIMRTGASDDRGVTFGRNLTIPLGYKNLKITAALATSCALHFACIFSVLGVTSWKPRSNSRQSSKHIENSSKNISTKKEKTEKLNPIDNAALTDAQKELAQRIESGEFGNTPTMRDLINKKVIRGGFKRVKPVFDYLEQNKKLVHVSGRFELVQKTIAS